MENTILSLKKGIYVLFAFMYEYANPIVVDNSSLILLEYSCKVWAKELHFLLQILSKFLIYTFYFSGYWCFNCLEPRYSLFEFVRLAVVPEIWNTLMQLLESMFRFPQSPINIREWVLSSR